MSLFAYTDYPVNGSTGVIKVEMLAYDRDKYVTVRHGDNIEEVKTGYLFQDDKLQQFFNMTHFCSLPSELNESKPTRRQVCAEVMAHRRRHHTTYTLWIGKNIQTYRNLHQALRHFGRVFREQDCALFRSRAIGRTWSSESFVESEGGVLVIPVRAGTMRGLLSAHHRRIGRF